MANEAVCDLFQIGSISAKATQCRAAGGHVSKLERAQVVHAIGDPAKAECMGRYSVGLRVEELEDRTIESQPEPVLGNGF